MPLLIPLILAAAAAYSVVGSEVHRAQDKKKQKHNAAIQAQISGYEDIINRNNEAINEMDYRGFAGSIDPNKRDAYYNAQQEKLQSLTKIHQLESEEE